ncbi:P-loop containing nucleoside triphosphate hydrolase protein [Basidiobolus meristosporus CBS 931.73]|uniref:p-loop containing nucleoside triphosphate hydrolase protein n=1 Tax=Basidiobolus meristosporus CBS 931.73 TaxID=1314790 RepID=A0A1Y1Z4H4_9FUNG|nr:P-loop containing nucleoside triphosphate hydrolase protein [Basidiobolus meristosporus CBS 931.73]|eukprot:ORY04735.1 P-loop containing nucleoside triphosphate hydrolase protein [Basidiobolus meristosporus CBS 931.73]
MSTVPPDGIPVSNHRTAHKVETPKQGKHEKDSDSDSDDSDSGGGLADIVGDYQKPPEARKYQPRRGIKLIDLPNLRAHPLELRRARIATENQTKARLTPDLSHLHKFIFGWKYNDNGDLPANISKSDIRAVPKVFESPEEYIDVFEPLLLLECWQQFVRAKEELNDSEAVDCTVVNRLMVDGFHDITLSLASSDAQGINENDLLHVFRQKSSGINGAKITDKSFLCKVQSSNIGRDMTQVTVRSAFGRENTETLLAINPKTIWKASKLFSLTTVHREYSALQSIGYYNLCDDVLNAKSSSPPSLNDDIVEKCMKTYLVNQPQAEAILHVLRREQGFSLIQGPPGTGKTKTILGLIGAVLSSRNPDKIETRTEETSSSKKVLVCAPSNAAVDELVKRLKDGIRDSNGAAFKPKVVRIGIFESINSSAKEMSLEHLVEKEMNSPDSEYSKSKKNLNNASSLASELKEKMRAIVKERDELKDMMSRSTDAFAIADMEAKVKQLNSKRWNLAKQLDGENDRKSTSYRALDIAKRKIRTKILTEADIVCSTLSGSGHEQLTSLAVDFETVIIDEAAQSIELSSLIPLKYGCRRCVLVGDPNQLPPTVLSQVAASYSYEQSLFVRIQNHCPDAVHLLSIQYRMHPEISAFPSKLFYGSKLRDGPNLAQIKTQKWHENRKFAPYNFLNVHSGREEIGRGKSLYNTKEAEIAVALVHHLCKAFPTINFSNRIGIITPYKQQLRELRRRFESAFGQTITQVIDFNTVDGFQGQEKDIIIFSCVRAGNRKWHGIGFLADIRRMNVGLTRARYSLFILGNSKSLLENKYWRPLVEDAQERKCFVDVIFTAMVPSVIHD